MSLKDYIEKKQMKKTASVYPYLGALGAYGIGRGFGKTDKQKQMAGTTYGGTVGALGFGIDAMGQIELNDKLESILKKRSIVEEPKFKARLQNIEDVYDKMKLDKAKSINKGLQRAIQKYKSELRASPGQMSKKEFAEFIRLRRDTMEAARDVHLAGIDLKKARSLSEESQKFFGFRAKNTGEYQKTLGKVNRYRKGFPLTLLAGGAAVTLADQLKKNKRKTRRRK